MVEKRRTHDFDSEKKCRSGMIHYSAYCTMATVIQIVKIWTLGSLHTVLQIRRWPHNFVFGLLSPLRASVVLKRRRTNLTEKRPSTNDLAHKSSTLRSLEAIASNATEEEIKLYANIFKEKEQVFSPRILL